MELKILEKYRYIIIRLKEVKRVTVSKFKEKFLAFVSSEKTKVWIYLIKRCEISKREKRTLSS